MFFFVFKVASSSLSNLNCEEVVLDFKLINDFYFKNLSYRLSVNQE